jgi:hypothetical protein
MIKIIIMGCHNPFRWYRPMAYLQVLIRLFQGLKYPKKYARNNHIAIKRVDTNEVWESLKQGFVKRPFSVFQSKDDRRDTSDSFVVEIPQADWDYIESCEGKKYDFANTLVHQPIFFLTGKWKGRVALSQNKLQCAEVAAKILGMPNAVTACPASVIKYLYENGYIKVK